MRGAITNGGPAERAVGPSCVTPVARARHSAYLLGVTAKKSGRKTRQPKGLPRGTPIPGKHGGTLIAGAGRGPKKGAPNAGRPPDEWKAKLRAMASRDEVMAHVETVLLAGPDHPFFDRALQYVTDHGYGRATQPVEHSGSIGLADLLTAATRGAE